MRCHACAADNKVAAKFCCKCGERISAGVSSMSVVIPLETKVCSTCLYSCKPDAKFCVHCGAPFAIASPVEKSVLNASLSSEQTAEASPSDPSAELSLGFEKEVAGPVATVTNSFPFVDDQLPRTIVSERLPAALGRDTSHVAITAVAVAVMVVAGGGGYWYLTLRSNSQVVVVSKPVAGGSSGANSDISKALSSSSQGSPAHAPSRQPTTSLGTAQGRSEVDPATTTTAATAPKLMQKNSEKRIDQSATELQRGRLPSNGVEPTRTPVQASKQATQTVSLQAARTCQSTGGLYRLTCEIEGAQNYFKCAPDGRNWKHDIPGCDRRSTNQQ